MKLAPKLRLIFIGVILLVALVSVSVAKTTSTLIRDTRIVDGTGNRAFIGAVRIENGVIKEIGKLTPRRGDRVVSGKGMILAPGFIDTHRHYSDRAGPTHPAAISQGITTIIIGNDGSSPYPLSKFYKSLETNPLAVNLASYVGHGTLRVRTMGEDFRRPATASERATMLLMLSQELKAGGLGLSTGLEYDPGIYSTTEEIIELARVAQKEGGRYISHMRSEDRDLEKALDELIRIGRETNIPVQISHFKLARRSLWGKADSIIERLDKARAEGVNVTADIYPYEYWQSTMTVLFPDRDFDNPKSAKYALTELVAPDEMIIVRYDAEISYVGKTLAQISKLRKSDPVTTYMDLIALARKNKAGESIVARSMTEEDIQKLLQWPFTNVCSDGAEMGSHPRGAGSYPRALRIFVRENGALSLESAIHKMTGLAAKNTGLKGRGVLRAGAPADLVLFELDKITDNSTFEHPQKLSTGVSQVWVNGVSVFENGKATGARPGKVLKRVRES